MNWQEARETRRGGVDALGEVPPRPLPCLACARRVWAWRAMNLGRLSSEGGEERGGEAVC